MTRAEQIALLVFFAIWSTFALIGLFTVASWVWG